LPDDNQRVNPLAIALWVLAWPVSFGVLTLMLRWYRRTPMTARWRWIARVTGGLFAFIGLAVSVNVSPESAPDGVAFLALGPPFAALGLSFGLLMTTREMHGANLDRARLERLRERDPELMDQFEQYRVIRFIRWITRSQSPR
jgi:hypothetical protein